jgi:hypothetical protein
MSLPSWLPPLFNVSPWHHDTYELLYQIFHKDFVVNKTKFLGKKILVSKQKDEEKELTFWHITSRKDEVSKERFPDTRRCERLPWLKPMLEGSPHPDVLCWENIEGSGRIRVYVWLKDYDYVAIMEKTKNGLLILITAYWIEYENEKRKFMKKYESTNKEANA